jgi:hypothetical protein
VTNIGVAPAVISDLSSWTRPEAPFQLLSSTCPGTLSNVAGQNSCTITLSLTPSSTVLASGSLGMTFANFSGTRDIPWTAEVAGP